MSILELGCGNGRVTNAMGRKGLRVIASDLNYEVIRAARVLTMGTSVSYLQFDARCLPFEDSSFDAVVFAFNGLDYIYPETARIETQRDIARVLKPGGLFVFSSHNPVGIVLCPRGRPWLPRFWRERLTALRSIREPYVRSVPGMFLYQATPQKIIRQVTSGTGLKLVKAFGRPGLSLPLWLLYLFDAWPYFVFQKPA
jgi:SAM-dependent methyltransferase